MMSEMLPLAARVGKSKVDVFDVVLLDHLHDFSSVRHCKFLFKDC
jgi:hypothetical protein